MRVFSLLVVVLAAMSLTACEVVGGIFKAGMGVGVLMAVVVVALVGFLAMKLRA